MAERLKGQLYYILFAKAQWAIRVPSTIWSTHNFIYHCASKPLRLFEEMKQKMVYSPCQGWILVLFIELYLYTLVKGNPT